MGSCAFADNTLGHESVSGICFATRLAVLYIL